MDSQEIILGVDGGATKTKSIIVDSGYNLLGVGEGGSGNYQYVGVERARKNVEESIENALSEAGVEKKDIMYGGFGMGSLDTKADYDIISGFLGNLGYVDKKYIVSDVVLAHYAVTGGGPGITIEAGTGSISYGINRKGKDCYVGGWGWLIGDEGSGFYVARRGLQEATKAYDGRGETTTLTNLAQEHFGLDEFDRLRLKVHKELESPLEISTFAKCVVEAASQGDRVALRVIEEASEELADAALTIKRTLQMEEPVKVGGVGSFLLSSLVFRKFEEKVRSKIPNVEILKPVNNPVVGAVALVSEKIGKRVTIGTLQKLNSEIERSIKKIRSQGCRE